MSSSFELASCVCALYARNDRLGGSCPVALGFGSFAVVIDSALKYRVRLFTFVPVWRTYHVQDPAPVPVVSRT
ncbi:hypothetical protein M6B38_386920 [Iris pallida]|uniref:Uncharacterized protein n=1 Tax=Iris pallida TaxID=29817 RepID=A0AAX6G1M1_IRIPA|nr:hypothetical protein M6B38_386920 [Iris pallida]